MIDETILHYKILKKIGEACLHLNYGWLGGPFRRSLQRRFKVYNDR